MAERETGRRARFAGFEVDLATGELLRGGQRVRLQEQPFRILAALLERPGELVTREELRQRIWPADTFVDFDHSLNTAVKKLREALGDSAAVPEFLETLPRRGYRFLPPVTFLPANGLGAASAPGPATSSEHPAIATATSDLPRPPRYLPRALFLLAQIMYLAFYVAALVNADAVVQRGELFGSGMAVLVAVVVTAMTGIPVRFYLLNAVAFDYRGLGGKFARIFPWLLVVDLVWSLAPFLLAHRIGLGAALAACAALTYLPFGERTLVRMAYPQ